MKNNNFDGDVSVGRNLATGGDANIQGSATIGHNLKVKGWLEADNIKDTCKGMFETVEKLRLAYPLPKDGWWALVGDSLPAKIYLAEAGEWNASGGTSGLPTLDSQQLEDILGNFPAMQENIFNNKKAIDQTKENLSALQQQHTLDKSALDATIATEQAERSQTDLNLQEAIDAEVQSRTSEDNAIKQKLATETLNRQAGDNSLDGKITAETTARTDADTALGERIDNLSTAMDNGDQELHEALRDEEHNRQSADTKLGERITTLENVGAGKVVKRLSANYVSNGDLNNPENNLELISTLVDNKGAETTEKITIPSATNNNDGIMSKEKARFLSSLAGLQLFGASDGYSNEPVATNNTVTLNFPLMEVNNQGDYSQSDTGTDYVLKQATAIEAGLMSSDDKNKLDAMEDKIITRVLSIEEAIRQDFSDADIGLGNRITEETTARTEADKVLTDNLAEEVTARLNQDDVLEAKITEEKNVRIAKDDVIFTVTKDTINDAETVGDAKFAWALTPSVSDEELNARIAKRANFYVDVSLDTLGFLPYLKYIKLESIPENTDGVFSGLIPPASEFGYVETTNIKVKYNAKHKRWIALFYGAEYIIPTATADANGLMSKEDKATLDALPTQLTAEQTAREQADTAINGEIQGIKDKGSLFDLFKAAGATLNSDGTTWSMNGITDLTTQELINAYQRRPIGPYLVEVYSNVQPRQKFRTNFPIPSWYNPIIDSADRLCFENPLIEVLQIGGTKNIAGSYVILRSCTDWLYGAKKLRIILGPQFDVGIIKFSNRDFKQCQALEDIRLKYLKSNIYFQDSPNLNKDSIVFMITEATPLSPITITLHPTAYAMATADPEIQAELEKQPNISLAEGEPTA